MALLLLLRVTAGRLALIEAPNKARKKWSFTRNEVSETGRRFGVTKAADSRGVLAIFKGDPHRSEGADVNN